jgi:hypothetical protein
MRYPLTHKTRHSVIAAVLLVAVAALAAAAAHASKVSAARGDISLVNPLPDRATQATTPDIRRIAPLFAGRSSAASASTSGAEGFSGAFASRGSASSRRFELVSRTGFAGSSYRNFAGERRSRGSSGGSNGSGGFGAGGGGGGGGFGGVSGTARSSNSTATTARGPRASNGSRQSSGSRPGAGSGGGGIGVSVLPGNLIATVAPLPLNDSPGTSSTPEPLTLLLVGSGLAGLYGARKHLAG